MTSTSFTRQQVITYLNLQKKSSWIEIYINILCTLLFEISLNEEAKKKKQPKGALMEQWNKHTNYQ